ncbi:MAG: D-alanine--D-alanine ligase, partial [Mariprofundaceae bacterium]
MGGASSEREISLRSGAAVLAALQAEGLDACGLDLRSGEDWAQAVASSGIDLAFIALHGTWGEDGCIQGLLEILGIPYTGSGVTASALCMNKRLTKQTLAAAGLKTPVDIPIGADGPLRYPVFVKPVAEGSSIGLHRLDSAADWKRLSLDPATEWMAEMPVQGAEVAVSVLDGIALPPVEVEPENGIYDFVAKYTAGATRYHCPARLPAETLRRAMEVAQEAVRACGCAGAPRVDLIVPDGGEPVVLEINTIPGMTETS